MKEQIEVNCDYDVLVGHSDEPFENLANYEVKVLDSRAGKATFKVDYCPLGELGTFTIKKEAGGCRVTFSDLTVIENWPELVKQHEQELNQWPEKREEIILRFRQMQMEMMNPDPQVWERKKKVWKETMDRYKSLVARWQTAALGADAVPDSHKRGKPGRPKSQDDLWAWEQVNTFGRPLNEVYLEWQKREGVDSRTLEDPHRQFNRITQSEWGKKTK